LFGALLLLFGTIRMLDEVAAASAVFRYLELY
jgi:hypothetical protein